MIWARARPRNWWKGWQTVTHRAAGDGLHDGGDVVNNGSIGLRTTAANGRRLLMAHHGGDVRLWFLLHVDLNVYTTAGKRSSGGNSGLNAVRNSSGGGRRCRRTTRYL